MEVKQMFEEMMEELREQLKKDIEYFKKHNIKSAMLSRAMKALNIDNDELKALR